MVSDRCMLMESELDSGPLHQFQELICIHTARCNQSLDQARNLLAVRTQDAPCALVSSCPELSTLLGWQLIIINDVSGQCQI
jgi:hypothetical protein